MNRLLTTLFATVLGLGLTLPAHANHDGMGEHCQMHSQMSFEQADTDHDGSLDREEASALHQKHFDQMDTDHDGTLSNDEMKACVRHQHGKKSAATHDNSAKRFDAADLDHDGSLTREEAKKLPHLLKNFDAIDADHDGTVDREEMHQYMHEHK